MIKEYASLYSQKEGGFSKKLATNLLGFLKGRHYMVKSILDVACGTGEFLSVMGNGCSDLNGFDFEPAMIEIARKQVPDATLVVKDLFDFDFGRTFDLISCNYETVNFALNTEQLDKLFGNIAKHLSDNGIFVFDFKTPLEKVADDFVFEEGVMFDYLKDVSTNGLEYKKHEIFYAASKDNYHKIVNDEVRRAWDVKDIKAALARAGFVNENWVDYDLRVLKNPKKCDRVHCLCYKRKV